MSIKYLSAIILFSSIFSGAVFATSIDTMQPPADDATTIQSTTTTTTTDTEHEALSNKININMATTRELKQIPGITSNKARAIVKYRKQHGDFKSLDDLKLVNGFKRMSNATLKGIQEQMSVG